jgi:hypothetical protein
MGVPHPYRHLFSNLLRTNPQTEELQDICRILLEQDFAGADALKDLAFPEPVDAPGKTPASATVFTTRKGDHETDETTIGAMTSITELPKALKKEFMLPDLIFDTKLLKKEILVHKKNFREKRKSWDQLFEQQCELTPHKQQARQKTYILMDVSASTELHHRLVIEKAIAIAYLESNLKQRGEIYFRAFHHGLGPLHLCQSPKDYQHLINNVIMQAQPMGRTNLQLAIKTAFEDLNHHPSDHPAEVLILTDGLCVLDLEALFNEPPPSKIHVVLIGGDRPDLRDREVREHFDIQHRGQSKDIAELKDNDERSRRQHQLDQLFSKKKDQLRESLLCDMRQNIEDLAKRTKGKFIHIPDIDDQLTCHSQQYELISKRIQEIETLLYASTSTVLDKEQLMDELLSLRAYLQDLSDRSSDSDLKDDFEELIQRTGELTLDSDELQAMLENLQVRMKVKSGTGSKLELTLSQTLELTWKIIKRQVQKFFPKRK